MPAYQQQTNNTHFFVGNDRVMVSLGPLTADDRNYCTFKCAHCYVHAGFSKYANMTPQQVAEWVEQVRTPFSIIYVSGDTDSFAPPRTAQGIELLRELSQFDRDLMFTTRAVLDRKYLDDLAQIQEELHCQGKDLYGCVSLNQLYHTEIEPKVPEPNARLEQLGEFKNRRIVSVLAMRPLLPNIPASEYLEIVDRAYGKVDIALGGRWYADSKGVLEGKVSKVIPIPRGTEFIWSDMPFNDNKQSWKLYKDDELETLIAKHCESLGLPFFVESRPAVEWFRKHKLKRIAT